MLDNFFIPFVVNDPLQHDLVGHNWPGAMPGGNTMLAGGPVL
jgi:hypothetical protein